MRSKTDEGYIRLRPMTAADLSPISAIEQASFLTPWAEKDFIKALAQNQGTLCWVAEWIEEPHPPRVVANVIVWLILDEAHIGTLAVHPEYRGRSIARRLLAKVLLEATRLGATHALLEVRACNQDALHLYNKFGFAVVGVRKGYYQDAGEDALLMTLNPLVPEILAELVDNR
ncbi:MAG: ribosomal protein S18-alanine N-acetyltransferase [Brevefilum fermentans]|jgi:ribosomal-protein-alanine N-acetyltransferase|uniref:Putative acetyltransferase n=1 Tax=Candidatus Brevifilum fermentans TaxID=1986204 RepID=A0A1Y6K0V5_9CHLR|nr:ribosomal protein S18-alanine N-acetyltransferase [Brevefilum fermentans]SMX53284.1 putative acetyltransferase [Brevefilum fermentans]HOM66862.1 ribosomal protein S18-alanine N-acetyltransferase [Brevefilum fermentans]